MNYRVLFFISILILTLGVGGLFFLPSETATSQDGESVTSQPEVPKIPEVVIVTAVADKALTKGMLLQAGDYTLSELQVEEISPLVQSDLKPLIGNAEIQSLQGFLVTENIASGSLLSKDNLISPDDSRFIISSLDPKQEVAYRIYLQDAEEYILDTLRQGDFISIFNQQQDLDSKETDKKNLIKLVDNLIVLQVKKNKVEDEKTDTTSLSSNKKQGYIGYVAVKINANEVKKFYSLEGNSKLIILPSHKSESTNHRGTFIRELRGNK